MTKEIMHQQFYHIILNKIKSGEWKNGEKIPAERMMCNEYNISRTTVREALRNLEIEGYVIRKQGSGNYVCLKPIQKKLVKLYTLREMFYEQGIKHDVIFVSFDIGRCDQEVSNRLGIAINEEIIKMIRVFLAAEIPYTIEYTYLPLAFFPDITKKMIAENGLYNALEKYGHKPTSAEETIQAVDVQPDQKLLLKLPDNILAIEINRVTYSGKKIIEYTKNIIRNDYFIYTVELK